MARQWNTREANSEERVCALATCGKTFWTAVQIQKYCCYEHGQKQAQLSMRGRQKEEKRTKRICKMCKQRFETTDLRLRYCSKECIAKTRNNLPGQSQKSFASNERDVVPFTSVWTAMHLPILDDPVFEYTDSTILTEDRLEVLDWLSHQTLVYGRFAELVATPHPFKVAVGRLEAAIESVGPTRVEEMTLWAKREQKKTNGGVPKLFCERCRSRMRVQDNFCARCGKKRQ